MSSVIDDCLILPLLFLSSGKKRPRSGSFPREKRKRVRVTKGPKSPADPGMVKKAKSMDTEKPLESPGKSGRSGVSAVSNQSLESPFFLLRRALRPWSMKS